VFKLFPIFKGFFLKPFLDLIFLTWQPNFLKNLFILSYHQHIPFKRSNLLKWMCQKYRLF
jgi:hypothetical protein